MTVVKNVFNRIHVQRLLFAAAFFGVSLNAHAVNKGNIGRAAINNTGKSTTVGPVTNSSGSSIPVSPAIGGWTQAGNYGVPPAATGQTVAIVTPNGQTVVGGSAQKYPFTASYSIPWSTVAAVSAGVICTVSTAGVCGVASVAAAASPYIMDWIKGSDGKVQLNPTTGQLEQDNTTVPRVSDGYRYSFVDGTPQWSNDPLQACQFRVDQLGKPGSVPKGWAVVSFQGGTICRIKNLSDLSETNIAGTRQSDVFCPTGSYIVSLGVCTQTYQRQWQPMSPGDVAQRMASRNPDPRVWGETLERGGEIPFPNPTVTGPTAIQGPESTTINPDGSRTVAKTTYNFQTSGNTITNTSNVTNTTTYNTDNSVRSSSSTTTVPTPEDVPKESECEKHPATVGCAELDTPQGEIPRDTKNVTFAAEDLLGAGRCPADVMASFRAIGGQSLKVVDWQTFCGQALPLRGLVLALASIMAFFIIMPGGVRE